eukprot:1713006-Alexandrium_andersonii.AAC.1
MRPLVAAVAIGSAAFVAVELLPVARASPRAEGAPNCRACSCRTARVVAPSRVDPPSGVGLQPV